MDVEEEEEAKSFRQVLKSFWVYKEYALHEYHEPRYNKWASLSSHQKDLLPKEYRENLEKLRDAIDKNSEFYKNVVIFAAQMFGYDVSLIDQWETPRPSDMDNTCSIFIQIYREWSFECQEERNILLSRIQPFLRDLNNTNGELNVLIPGVGTGRLMVDLCRLPGTKLNINGNEYSVHMLIISIFLLNANLQQFQFTIHPFIHCFSHWDKRENQLKGYNIPDIDVHSYMNEQNPLNMGMNMGSFVDCFGPNTIIQESSQYNINPKMRVQRASVENSIDIIITNFFMDTSINILDYLLTIHHVLKPNGYWINFGPLLYHFENDNTTDTTYETNPYTNNRDITNTNVPLKGLELTTKEILHIASNKLNFKPIIIESGIPSGYGKSESNIALPGYLCNYWLLQVTK